MEKCLSLGYKKLAIFFLLAVLKLGAIVDVCSMVWMVCAYFHEGCMIGYVPYKIYRALRMDKSLATHRQW
jgi:hypothetical protein